MLLMQTIQNYFCRAAPWQLCLLMVTPYLVYKFTAFGHHPLSFGALIGYFLGVVLGWIFTIGRVANRRLPVALRLPIAPFYLALAVPLFAVVIFVMAVLLPLARGTLSVFPPWLIYLHFSVVFAFGYCLWFAAKQLTTVALQRPCEFGDYYTMFLGLWFGFIGVWFVQPRVIALLGDE